MHYCRPEVHTALQWHVAPSAPSRTACQNSTTDTQYHMRGMAVHSFHASATPLMIDVYVWKCWVQGMCLCRDKGRNSKLTSARPGVKLRDRGPVLLPNAGPDAPTLASQPGCIGGRLALPAAVVSAVAASAVAAAFSGVASCGDGSMSLCILFYSGLHAQRRRIFS